MASKFCIKSLHDGVYLSASSRSYGTQGGIARLWTESIANAWLFDSAADAEAVIVEEWPNAKYRDAFVQPVA